MLLMKSQLAAVHNRHHLVWLAGARAHGLNLVHHIHALNHCGAVATNTQVPVRISSVGGMDSG